jgi:hypothetical protein
MKSWCICARISASSSNDPTCSVCTQRPSARLFRRTPLKSSPLSGLAAFATSSSNISRLVHAGTMIIRVQFHRALSPALVKVAVSGDHQSPSSGMTTWSRPELLLARELEPVGHRVERGDGRRECRGRVRVAVSVDLQILRPRHLEEAEPVLARAIAVERLEVGLGHHRTIRISSPPRAKPVGRRAPSGTKPFFA